MISKKVGFYLLLLVCSGSSFSQQHEHAQADDEKGHGDMSMKMGEGGGHGGMSMNVSHARHHFARDYGIAEPYKGLQSPLTESNLDTDSAQALYQSNCADCHGAKGLGDGAGGAGLDPAPTDIASFAKMMMAKDDYLFWTIAEGGEPVQSEMPGFKDVLSTNEIWHIVGYLRQLQE